MLDAHQRDADKDGREQRKPRLPRVAGQGVDAVEVVLIGYEKKP
jgi:hypothetical protein